MNDASSRANIIFHPNLSDGRPRQEYPGDMETYAMGYRSVRVWKTLQEQVRNRGFEIFGRRIGDEDNVSLQEGPLYLDIATNMPKEAFVRLSRSLDVP
jgi:hypothetical protein